MASTFVNTWGQEQWSKSITESLILQSALLRSPVPKIQTDAKVFHLPRLSVHPTAQWVSELETIPTDAGTEDVIAFTPYKIADATTLSTESIEDASVDVLDTFGQAMARGLSHAIDLAAFTATASSSTTPAGLFYGLTADETLSSETAVDLDNLLDGVTKIEGYGGQPDCCFISAADIGTLRKLKTSTGAYLLLQSGSLTGDVTARPAESFAGAPVLREPWPERGHADGGRQPVPAGSDPARCGRGVQS
jgi:HK97 family phage major capsid protein